MKLSKLFAGVGTLVLTAALALAVSAADPVVAWDFSNADDTSLYNEDGTAAFSVNQATAVYDAENACLTADVTGGDPFLNLPNYGEFPAENAYIRVKYFLSGITDWSTSVYFTTDTVAWSETGHWKGFYDGDDDEWCEQTFIMTECAAWSGTITDVRLDIFDNAYEGQLAKVAYVAVFATEEDANSFDHAAWQANGRPTTLAPAAATADTAEEATETANDVSSVTDRDSYANYASVKPTIDGKVDAIWDTTAAQESTYPGDMNGEGISGYTKILWDEDGIYYLAVVNDPTTLMADSPAGTDSVDFWVSETLSDDIGYPLEGDYQVSLSPYDVIGGYYIGNPDAPGAVIEHAAVINGDGTYVLEISMPWMTPDFAPEEGHIMGFNASFNNDIDGDAARDSWISWGPWDGMPYWSDSMWLSQVELVKLDVEVEAEEAPAEEAPVEEAPVEEAPVEEAPVEEAPAEEAPAEEVVVEEASTEATAEEATEEAAQTFDFGVIAAVAAIVSAAGYAISKKR